MTQRAGDSKNILLRKILEEVAPGSFRHGDSTNNLLRKILVTLGGTYRFDDTDNNLWRKILVQVGGTPKSADLDVVLERKTLVALGGTPRPGDLETDLLRKILDTLGASNALAVNWRNRVISNGGTVPDEIFAAHNIFANVLSGAGLTSKIYRLNTFSGDSFSSALVPFINTVGNAKDTNNGFVSGDWSQTGGLKGNGTSKELRTGVLDTQVSVSNLSLAFFGKNFEQTNTNRTAIGTLLGGSGASIYLAVRRPFTTPAPGFSCSQSNDAPLVREVQFSVGRSSGFLAGSAIGLGPMSGYYNGEVDSTQADGTVRIAPTTPSSRDFYIFSRNFGAGAPFDTATAANGFGYVIAQGLTATEIRALYSAMHNLFTTLGRV